MTDETTSGSDMTLRATQEQACIRRVFPLLMQAALTPVDTRYILEL